jgi:uncharacterized protein YdcH (DUF465 family)
MEELTLNQEISKIIKESEKLNDKILNKEKAIKASEKELEDLKIQMLEFDENMAGLLMKRAKLTKKIISKNK